MKYSWMLVTVGIGVASIAFWLHIQPSSGLSLPALVITGSVPSTGATSDIHPDRAERTQWSFEENAEVASLTLPPMSEALKSPAPRNEQPSGRLFALAYQYNTRIFERPASKPRPQGIVRRGTTLFAADRVTGRGCNKGAWYKLTTGGYACSRDGFLITPKPREPNVVQPKPDVDAALPFRYAKMAQGAPRFLEAPSEKELERTLAALATTPDDPEAPKLPRVVSDVMNGIYFVALPRTGKADDGEDFYRTVLGRTVRKVDATFKPDPQMHGEILGERFTLPLAFVWGAEPAEVSGPDGKARGTASKHARFAVHGEEMRNGGPVVYGIGKLGVSAARVRVARAITRPSEVPANARWVHINLSTQTLVAYDGDKPVFATLVSSGLENGFATPTGTFRVREKHITTTMSGPDPDAGYYQIAEIPWVQYYDESYALHGAFWHDEFGQTRSHGCTNISPADARWLFYFTRPELPANWHARRRAEGSYVHLTRSEES